MDVKAMRELYSVYSLKLAEYLIRHGFDIVSARPFQEDNRKVIFRFEITNELFEAIDTYKGR